MVLLFFLPVERSEGLSIRNVVKCVGPDSGAAKRVLGVEIRVPSKGGSTAGGPDPSYRNQTMIQHYLAAKAREPVCHRGT